MAEDREFFRQKRDRGKGDKQRGQHDQNLTGDNLFEVLVEGGKKEGGGGGGEGITLWGCLEGYARQSSCKGSVRSERRPVMFA